MSVGEKIVDGDEQQQPRGGYSYEEDDDNHKGAHKYLDEDTLRKGVVGVAWRVFEKNPGWQYDNHSHYHHCPRRIFIEPDHDLPEYLVSLSGGDCFCHIGYAEEFFYQGVNDGDYEQHIDGREAYLAPSADEVADEVSRSEQQLEQRCGQRARLYTPHLDEPRPDRSPGHGAVGGFLSADGAVIAYKCISAVVAYMFARHVVLVFERIFLPFEEFVVFVFQTHRDTDKKGADNVCPFVMGYY